MNSQVLKHVRENNPLIHNMTNRVVMNFTANGLLAFGGSPIMADAEEEVADIASLADGLLINIGTLNANELSAMFVAGQAANKKGIPVVLDPVGVAASSFRSTAVQRILNEIDVTAIKGNAGELAYLVDIPWETKGVESLDDGSTADIAKKVAQTYQTTAIVTGKTDVICTPNTNKHLINETGHERLTKITGAGCLLGSIVTACLTTDDPIEDQVYTALHFYGLAAEHAAKQAKGSGTFVAAFIDALSFELDQLGAD